MLDRGEAARVVDIHTEGAMRRRLMDLGLVPGTRVECLGHGPFGDPAAYLIRGAVIALRAQDARTIGVL